jgi:hypothetical protein
MFLILFNLGLLVDVTIIRFFIYIVVINTFLINSSSSLLFNYLFSNIKNIIINNDKDF